MLIAVARTLRGPVFFPLRALATAYTDFFRGLPLIICSDLVVFGVPALRLQGVTDDPVLLGGTALVLTYSAYVAEVFRAGIESVHPSQRAAARSLGPHHAADPAPRRAAAGRTPSGAAAAQRPGVAAEGHRARSRSRGAVDAVRAAEIIVGRSFNYTPYIVAGLLFVALTIPMTRFTDWVTARMDRRAGSREGPL